MATLRSRKVIGLLGLQISKSGIEVDRNSKLMSIAKCTIPLPSKNLAVRTTFLDLKIPIKVISEKQGTLCGDISSETLGMHAFHGDDLCPICFFCLYFYKTTSGEFMIKECRLSRKALCFLWQEAFDILKLAIVTHRGHTCANYNAKKRSSISVSIGPRSTRMPTTLSPDVTYVNVKAKFRNVMRCHKTLSKFAKSLTMWGHCDNIGPFPSSKREQIYTPCRTILVEMGEAKAPHPPMTPEMFANFLNSLRQIRFAPRQSIIIDCREPIFAMNNLHKGHA
ncbi:hypothetical protein Tco_0329172 [Tanacetum coccineum]